MYLVTELAGESDLIENDITVIREVASHLEGPIQVVVDLAKLDRSVGDKRIEKKVRVRMIDKKDDLMTMVRFADSKICCFSSSNYSMRVAHNIENKQWVASILKDPLSFVFEIEDTEDTDDGQAQARRNNRGFVFGMYGINDEGRPEVMLNGVYYSGGNDTATSSSIVGAIEAMLSQRIRAGHQLIASMYGGQIGGELTGYSNGSLEAKRLRALDDGMGNPETKIYDDLGLKINQMVEFGDKVWHKDLPKYEVPVAPAVVISPTNEMAIGFDPTEEQPGEEEAIALEEELARPVVEMSPQRRLSIGQRLRRLLRFRG
jgi:hypothetical protein